MLTRDGRRFGAMILLCAATCALAPSAMATERDVKAAAAVDTPAPLKNGELVFHGNYCGVGNKAGAEPIDALDVACMRHDACYDTAGYNSCACDTTLKREASVVSDSPRASLEVRRRALSVIEAATAMDCRTP